jgi:hypothetical protein
VAVQVALAVALTLIARSLVLTLVAMALTAVALPILYLLMGLATASDRALLGQVVARIKPR